MKILFFSVLIIVVAVLLWVTGSPSLAAEKRICPYPGCEAEIRPDDFTCGWVTRDGEARVCFKHAFDKSMDSRFKSLK